MGKGKFQLNVRHHTIHSGQRLVSSKRTTGTLYFIQFNLALANLAAFGVLLAVAPSPSAQDWIKTGTGLGDGKSPPRRPRFQAFHSGCKERRPAQGFQ